MSNAHWGSALDFSLRLPPPHPSHQWGIITTPLSWLRFPRLLKFVLRTPVLKNAGIMQDAIQVYGMCDYLNEGPVQYTASLQFSAL